MSGYDLLDGIRVLEVAHLGPSALGGYLADMGADVVKVEDSEGELVRHGGSYAVGGPDGVGFMHLRWNRGKRSIGLDLKNVEGAKLFKQLVRSADVVIEGMRAGVLERLGLGYEVLRQINPRITFCSVSGMGSEGPYSKMASHGTSFDAFGGLGAYSAYSAPKVGFDHPKRPSVGMHAVTLHAAVGTLSSVIRARRTGEGARIEVAACDSAAHWMPDTLDPALNESLLTGRPGHLSDSGKMTRWPLLHHYSTRDERQLFFMGRSAKSWAAFCDAIQRFDLASAYQASENSGEADEQLFLSLTEIFRTRDRSQWMELFLDRGVPAVPVNSIADLAEDIHFQARDNLYEVEMADVGKLQLTGTPIRVSNQHFAPTLAPERAEHSDDILMELLGLSTDEIGRLRTVGALV